MIKIYCQIDVGGRKHQLDTLKSAEVIPNGTLMQLGLKSKTPRIDAWLYYSPWYQLNNSRPFIFEAELIEFLKSHYKLRQYSSKEDESIDYANLTIGTFSEKENEGDELEQFQEHFSYDVIYLLQRLGLGIDLCSTILDLEDTLRWKEVSWRIYWPDRV